MRIPVQGLRRIHLKSVRETPRCLTLMNHLVLFPGLIVFALALNSCASNKGDTQTAAADAAASTGSPIPPSATASSFKETARADPAKTSPYPFTTCAVIRKDLEGSPRYRRVYKNQEVLFCCIPCVRAFDTNPEPYMPRIIAAAAAKARGETVNSGW